MLYTTINSSIEVVTIEKEGTETNKVKKIANDYYSVEDITTHTADGSCYLRFVGTGWLHAFIVEEKAYLICNKLKEIYPEFDFVVLQMHIPEHANYYLSEIGFEICSNRLVCLSKYM